MVVFTEEQVAEMNAKLDVIQKGVEAAAAAMHYMKQELCYYCGKYKQAHEGACDGCRWNGVL